MIITGVIIAGLSIPVYKAVTAIRPGGRNMTDKSKSNLGKSSTGFCVPIIWGGSFVVLKNAITTMPPYPWCTKPHRGDHFVDCLLEAPEKMNHTYLKAASWVSFFLSLCLSDQRPDGDHARQKRLSYVRILRPRAIFLLAVYRIRLDRYNILAALLCIIGIAFVSLREGAVAVGGTLISPGDVLTLISGIFYALHIVAVAKFASGKRV